MYPNGYSDHQSDDDKYIDLKAEIDEAIKNANFKVMSVTVDTLYNWYGKVSGTSVDYAASVSFSNTKVKKYTGILSERRFFHYFLKD